jgi:predicted sulfurtransferase
MKKPRICHACGEQVCRHGQCWCEDNGGGQCRRCSAQRDAESHAEREAAFQRQVAGPLLGFDEEDKP